MFDLFKDGSEWTFGLFDEAGAQLLRSQVYQRRRDALTGLESVRTNGKNRARYEVLDSPPRFILKASNGKEIAESDATFASTSDAEQAALETMTLLQSERVANPW